MGCNASKNKVSSQVQFIITTHDNNDGGGCSDNMDDNHLGRVVCVGPFDGPIITALSEDNENDNDNEVSDLDLEYDDDDNGDDYNVNEVTITALDNFLSNIDDVISSPTTAESSNDGEEIQEQGRHHHHHHHHQQRITISSHETEDTTTTITSNSTSPVPYDKNKNENENENPSSENENENRAIEQQIRTLLRRPSYQYPRNRRESWNYNKCKKKKFKGKIVIPPKICRTNNGNNKNYAASSSSSQHDVSIQQQQRKQGGACAMRSKIHDVLTFEGDNDCHHLLQMNLSSRSFRICGS